MGVVGVNEVFSAAIPTGRHMRTEFAAHIVHVALSSDIARVKCFNKRIPRYGAARRLALYALINAYCLEFCVIAPILTVSV